MTTFSDIVSAARVLKQSRVVRGFNDGTFVGIMHPQTYLDFVGICARAAWKEKSHRERWERRYGRPYLETKGKIGEIG